MSWPRVFSCHPRYQTGGDGRSRKARAQDRLGLFCSANLSDAPCFILDLHSLFPRLIENIFPIESQNLTVVFIKDTAKIRRKLNTEHTEELL